MSCDYAGMKMTSQNGVSEAHNPSVHASRVRNKFHNMLFQQLGGELNCRCCSLAPVCVLDYKQ
jgi:hypothetical protein